MILSFDIYKLSINQVFTIVLQMRYTHLIWDFDGTICNTWEVVFQGFWEMAKEHGYETNDDAVSAAISSGVTLEQAAVNLFHLEKKEDIHRCVKTYKNFYRDHQDDLQSLFPGIKAVLETCKINGHKNIICSNKGPDSIREAITQFKLEGIFDHIVGFEVGLPTKPDPAVFNDLIRPHFPDIPLEQFIMIGDTSKDILFANNLGIDSCWVEYGFGTASTNSTPTFVAPHPEVILNRI